MPRDKAEALTDGSAESLKEFYATRESLDARRAENRSCPDTRLASLRTVLVMWMAGTVGIGTLLNHWRR